MSVARKIGLSLLAVLVLGGIVEAVNPAIQINGLQLTSLATSTIRTGKDGIWNDSSHLLRFDSNGSTTNYIPFCPVTTLGDLCIATGTGWQVLATGGNGNDGNVLTLDHTTATGWKVATAGGGGVVGVSHVATGTALGVVAGSNGETHGTRFFTTAACHVSGVKFVWGAGGAKTMKCSVWDVSGSRLANGTAAVNAGGPYTCSFGASQQSFPMEHLVVGVWVNDGSASIRFVAPSGGLSDLTSGKETFVPSTVANTYVSGWYWAAGDNEPTSGVASEGYPVDPVVVCP